MKRLVISSDSDSDEIDISKIKDKYKRPNKVAKKDTTVKVLKSAKEDQNQMSIFAAFENVKSPKRKPENIMDKFIIKTPKVDKIKISPEDFFSLSKNSLIENRENIITTTLEVGSKMKLNSFVVENSPQIKNDAKKKSKSPLKHANKNKIDKINVENVNRKHTSPLKPAIRKKIDEKSSENEMDLFLEEDILIFDDKDEKIKTPLKTKIKNEGTPVVASPNNRSGFAKFMHREGPLALGSKEIPEGSPNCLVGLTFVITGVLDSIERDDAQSLIERHGGRVTKAVSGKTSYLLVGIEPGQSKVDKAEKLKVKQMNEDELFEMIRSKSSKMLNSSKPRPSNKVDTPKAMETFDQIEVMKADKSTNLILEPKQQPISLTKDTGTVLTATPIIAKQEPTHQREASTTLFVDKYRPTTFKKIIGQHGARSPANKLMEWLKNFDANLRSESKSEEDGSRFRAALLSGPPGIGKTTTAQIVCKELGYHPVEMNASDIRSKNSIKSIIADSLQTTSFYQNKDLKHCLIMDEVDGMAGNEDRGGINELMQIIKTTRYPIICICNDRQSRKLQTFVKYVYDLRFRQLTPEMVKATILSVAFKEKIQLPDNAISTIVKASNFDMRQVLNNLQFWAAGKLDSDTLQTDAKSACKEFKLGPFDVLPKVFSHENVKTMSEKSDLFFQDYQLGGLFVQENYLNVRPYAAKGDVGVTMKLMSLAADSIAMGDICGKKISVTNNWGILPMQAMFASVLPGEYLHGRLSARIEFPSWLGKYSKSNKNARILCSVSSHLSLSSRGGVRDAVTVAMDYGDLLVRRLVGPLGEGDVTTVLSRLNDNQLTKEDLELLVEATSWCHRGSVMTGVSSQSKAALTRAYNKAAFRLPYVSVSVKKMTRSAGGGGGGGENVDYYDEEGNVVVVEEEQDDAEEEVEEDIMVTKKKTTVSKKSTHTAVNKKSATTTTKKKSDTATKKPAAKRAKK